MERMWRYCKYCIKDCNPDPMAGEVVYCPEYDDGVVSIWTRIAQAYRFLKRKIGV